MVAKKSNRTQIKHKCRKNWVGSAKAMEMTLVESLLNVTYDAHNAEKDVEVLQRLVYEKGNVEILISEQCFFYSSQLSTKGVVPTKHSLSSLVSKTVISKHICGKIQKAGLGYMHLLLAFKRGGFDGLQLLLG